MSLLYEGKAERIFFTAQSDVLRIEYKDEDTDGNGVIKDVIEGRGRLHNKINTSIVSLIQDRDVNNNFIEKLSETEQLIESVNSIELEVIVRNIAAGSITKRLGFDKGHEFESPLVQFFYKSDDLNDPLISEDHIQLLNIASK